MYSVICNKCGKGPCRMFDVSIDSNKVKAVVVDDPALAITAVKRKGCPNVISVGLLDIKNDRIINPQNVLFLDGSKDFTA